MVALLEAFALKNEAPETDVARERVDGKMFIFCPKDRLKGLPRIRHFERQNRVGDFFSRSADRAGENSSLTLIVVGKTGLSNYDERRAASLAQGGEDGSDSDFMHSDSATSDTRTSEAGVGGLVVSGAKLVGRAGKAVYRGAVRGLQRLKAWRSARNFARFQKNVDKLVLQGVRDPMGSKSIVVDLTLKTGGRMGNGMKHANQIVNKLFRGFDRGSFTTQKGSLVTTFKGPNGVTGSFRGFSSGGGPATIQINGLRSRAIKFRLNQ
ncbi:MAG: hypothetical protein MK130_07820 [Puniceicoccaceae bacterium]|nr:hypothetical protein [Puniceicoccaceae bacterium]